MSNKILVIIALFAAVGIAGLGIIRYQQQTQPHNQTQNEEVKAQEKVKKTTQEPMQPTQKQFKTLEDFAPNDAQEATLVTTKGEITFTLFRDKAPLTTANFLDLAAQGFYEGIVFHRIIPDFMAQVGDPLTKDESQQFRWGSGGPGYQIEDEFNPELRHSKPGIVSMANAGANTGGSQFFITYEATPWLDDKHAVFGEVTSGMDVLEQLEMGDKIVEIKLK
jgi:cyclophilin family peptidyl-prolyl cis-trans isomerase